MVFGESDGDNNPSISLDNYTTGLRGGRYLLEKGYREIAFLLGEERFRSSQLRIAGFRDAMKENDSWYGIFPGVDTVEKAYCKALKVMDTCPVRAFFVSGDERALGVYRAIYEIGLSIPGDIAVLGIDNIPGGRFYYPPISTLTQDFEGMSVQCLDYLERQIREGLEAAGRKKIICVPEVLERQST